MRLIELHILQSFPVTCLNRDDVGAPKSALFGGVPRARVSSQCWKRAIRLLAKDSDSNTFAGQRSCLIIDPLKKLFMEKGQPENAASLLTNAVADALGKVDSSRPDKVKTLLYFSPEQLNAVVAAALSKLAEADIDITKEETDKKKKEKTEKKLAECAEKAAKLLGGAAHDAADIAIFGRMVASDPSLTLEGAGMFSHALSTHQVANEVDFFSAVDDLKPDDSDAGAGHIGTIEFNSACYYRYVGLNWDLLGDMNHLAHFTEEQRKKVVATFLEAAILAVPNARRNSMFGSTSPQHVLGLVRAGQPLSLVNAFESSVRPKNGYVQPSNEAMAKHVADLKKTYDGLGVTQEAMMPEKSLKEFIGCLLAAKELNHA